MDTERKPTYDELVIENQQLREENAQLKLRVAEQEVVIEQQNVKIAQLEQQVAELQAKVDKLTKMLFGKKSEKSKKKIPTLTMLPKSSHRMLSRRMPRRKENANAAAAVASRFRRKFRVTTCMFRCIRTNAAARPAAKITNRWGSRSVKCFITSRWSAKCSASSGNA
jgi:uncharacterized coiled-coil protein SlyX